MLRRGCSCLLAVLLLLGSVAVFSSCGRQPQRYTKQSYDLFDTVTEITGYASDRAEFDRIADGVLTELTEYHRLYDIYHTYEGLSNLATVNSLVDGVHPTVTVDGRILDLLETAVVLWSATHGKMNVAMGSVLSLWHTCRSDAAKDPALARLPSPEALEQASHHTAISSLRIDRATQSVQITDPHMTLDVGALAKGYAVECVAQRLESEGIAGYCLNVGGNVRTVGTKPEGERWLVGVERPDGGTGYAAELWMSTGALVTSGSYQRHFTVDQVRYHHIIDPGTRMPADAFSSVSVYAPSAALADALSTALFCMSYEEGLALLQSYPSVGVLWITREGTSFMNDVFSKLCKPAGSK